ncbi:hypothetical protein M8818_003584 [Zalaria obscura]|uniref:Uncharacterized protein n=1 Tax=Zalaria obscura TaxID=2024903 RepID=A0ACC3SGT6_9PEZI
MTRFAQAMKRRLQAICSEAKQLGSRPEKIQRRSEENNDDDAASNEGSNKSYRHHRHCVVVEPSITAMEDTETMSSGLSNPTLTEVFDDFGDWSCSNSAIINAEHEQSTEHLLPPQSTAESSEADLATVLKPYIFDGEDSSDYSSQAAGLVGVHDGEKEVPALLLSHELSTNIQSSIGAIWSLVLADKKARETRAVLHRYMSKTKAAIEQRVTYHDLIAGNARNRNETFRIRREIERLGSMEESVKEELDMLDREMYQKFREFVDVQVQVNVMLDEIFNACNLIPAQEDEPSTPVSELNFERDLALVTQIEKVHSPSSPEKSSMWSADSEDSDDAWWFGQASVTMPQGQDVASAQAAVPEAKLETDVPKDEPRENETEIADTQHGNQRVSFANGAFLGRRRPVIQSWVTEVETETEQGRDGASEGERSFMDHWDAASVQPGDSASVVAETSEGHQGTAMLDVCPTIMPWVVKKGSRQLSLFECGVRRSVSVS